MKLITNYPVAYDSPDHLYPWGTKNDNSTSYEFINEIENYFQNKKPLKFLDIGCSGGQLVVDFHNRGHISVGIEGSDYSVKHQRANWPSYYNKNLFTCDAAKEYKIQDDNNNKILFDCISAWEVVEHINPTELDTFFVNIKNHMHDKSIFVGSISLVGDYHDGNGQFEKNVELHQSVFSYDEWTQKILSKHFIVESYPFLSKVRDERDSFYVKLTKK